METNATNTPENSTMQIDTTENNAENNGDTGSDTIDYKAMYEEAMAEVEKVKRESKRNKAAFDKAASELAAKKREDRARMSQEEQAEAERQEKEAAREARLQELEKKDAVSTIFKAVIPFVGDESSATALAESLYGAADVDAAVDTLSKAWAAKEKKLRAEFSKLPPPGAGGVEDDPQAEYIKMATAFGKQRSASMSGGDNGLSRFMVR